MNLLTAVTASATVLIVYLVILEITNSKIASLAGSLALTVSHAFWLHAVITEVYDLNACFAAAVILALLKWRRNNDNYKYLYLAAFLFGLGLTNHRIMAFDTAGVIIFILVTEPKIMSKAKVIFSAIIAFIAGNLLLIYSVIRGLMKKPAAGVADLVTAEGYKGAVSSYSPDLFKEIGLYISYLFYQFPLFGFFLGFIGLAALFKNDRKVAVLFSLLLFVNAVFFIKFGPAYGTTKYTFYISAYMVFSILIGYGVFSFQQILNKKNIKAANFSIVITLIILLLPIALYNIAPYATKTLGIDILHARTLPYRDNAEYFLNPNKRGYTGPAKYAEEVFRTASPGSIIVADHTPYTVLLYFQKTKGIRNDIELFLPGDKTKDRDGRRIVIRTKDIVRKYYGSRDIYLADMEEKGYYMLGPLRSDYDFVPEGILYRIVKK